MADDTNMILHVHVGAYAVKVNRNFDENLIAGNKRVYKCKFSFAAIWDALNVRVSFRNGDTVIQMLLPDDNDAPWNSECEIPWECLQKPGSLRIGIIGTDDQGTVRVSLESPILPISAGTPISGDEPQDATPNVIAQLHAQARAAFDQVTQAIADLEQRITSGEFKGADGLPGRDGAKGDKGEKGDTGAQGEKGEKGDVGDVMFATFHVDDDGNLIMTTPDGYTGATFRLNNNYDLEVVIDGSN